VDKKESKVGRGEVKRSGHEPNKQYQEFVINSINCVSEIRNMGWMR
jgi:hypothetical protein